MSYILLAAAVVALLYQLASLWASLHHLAKRDPVAAATPGISVLKPVRGLDPHFRDAIRSHAVQDYPEYELLFGIADPGDPAAVEIRRLAEEFPAVSIREVVSEIDAPNRKVGTMESLAARARYSILVVNDSDISVPSSYLRQIVAPMEDPGVGLVTCLYRATADTWPGRLEALGIATDFAPSVLVAPLAGVREFGLGSTLVFRAADLERIGGFASIREYLADDYELARRITGLGLRVHVSRTVVETALGAPTPADVWKHQVRWHRTIRACKGAAYWGIAVTQATLWGLLAIAAGWWTIGALTLAARVLAGVVAGGFVLGCPITKRLAWLIPFRDLIGVAVWAAGLLGQTVEWRGRHLLLSRDGRILRSEAR